MKNRKQLGTDWAGGQVVEDVPTELRPQRLDRGHHRRPAAECSGMARSSTRGRVGRGLGQEGLGPPSSLLTIDTGSLIQGVSPSALIWWIQVRGRPTSNASG